MQYFFYHYKSGCQLSNIIFCNIKFLKIIFFVYYSQYMYFLALLYSNYIKIILSLLLVSLTIKEKILLNNNKTFD